MTLGINGPGVGLPFPQYLYPSELNGAPIDVSTSRVALAPGEAFVIPRGNWVLGGGPQLVTQFLDPLTNSWVMSSDGAYRGGTNVIQGDGFNTRIANMTGCIVSAEVTAAGSGFTSAPTLTPSIGSGTTILPIIGGAVSLNTIVFPGAGYGLPPLLLIPAPPGPKTNSNGIGGKAASAYAVLANGTVSAVSFISQGAGYNSPPVCTVVTNPMDPNIATITTPATITFSLTASGALTGAIVTNPGSPLGSSVVTNGLSIAVTGGGGSGATIVPVIMQSVVSASVTVLGGGYSAGMPPALTTSGGIPNTGSALADSASKLAAWRPRPAQIGLNLLATQISTAGNIFDPGLFLGAPTPIILTSAATLATIVLTLGGVNDFFELQPTT